MTTAPRHEIPPKRARRSIRTINDIREALPEDQRRHFDRELGEADLAEVPEVLETWVTLGFDGFEEFLLSKPFLGLEFGKRSYDNEDEGPGE